jgi:hypothetical protein
VRNICNYLSAKMLFGVAGGGGVAGLSHNFSGVIHGTWIA